MIGLKPLLNDSKVSSPSMPGRPVRVCQLQWFPSCLRHHLSPWGSICESWRELLSFLPAISIVWLTVQLSYNELPSSLPQEDIALSAYHFILPIVTSSPYGEPTINPQRIIQELWRRKGVGWGGPSLFHLPCGIQRIPLHLQTCDVGIPSSGTFWSSLCSFFFFIL